MHDADVGFINEEFYAGQVSPAGIDALWADGWRHFGSHFFRYNLGVYEFDFRIVIPLRIRLKEFSASKSQRRVLRRNQDVVVDVRSIEITAPTEELFARHKQRFSSGSPDSIFDFLADNSDAMPVEAKQLAVFENGSLVAVSYFDVGATAVSGIYAMFEPSIKKRSLGIFTLLKEIEFAIDAGKEFYYLGYAYEGESFYDYKKRFRGTEAFDWCGRWSTFEERTKE
ncbi:MAG TPA: hypothetical protein VJL58_08715 [Pyrinomonadaceae bacterium]|nr:hypothetical protein [Pyrinomonadaceae bacterium]